MFRVEWLQIALDELTNLWTQSNSAQRQAITSASHALENRLRRDPANEGESRPGGRRITFVPLWPFASKSRRTAKPSRCYKFAFLVVERSSLP